MISAFSDLRTYASIKAAVKSVKEMYMQIICQVQVSGPHFISTGAEERS